MRDGFRATAKLPRCSEAITATILGIILPNRAGAIARFLSR